MKKVTQDTNKLIIINKLIKENHITFEEAVILLSEDYEVVSNPIITYPWTSPYMSPTITPTIAPLFTTSNSENGQAKG